MEAIIGFFFTVLLCFGILAGFFFVYAMRWSYVEKQVRKKLDLEYKNRTDQTTDLLEREHEAKLQILKQKEVDFQRKLSDLMIKQKEADEMKGKYMNSGRQVMKKRIFDSMAEFIEKKYKSAQSKRRVEIFVEEFKEEFNGQIQLF